MTLNSKVLGVVAVLWTIGLTDVRAQGTQPGAADLRQEQFAAFLLGQREIGSQDRIIRPTGLDLSIARQERRNRGPRPDRPPASPSRPPRP